MRFEVFICYRRNTAMDFAKHLKDGLEEGGIRTFLDIEDIPKACSGTEQWTDAVNDAIEKCKILVLILTFGFDFSTEVKRELSLARKIGKKKFIYFRHETFDTNATLNLEDGQLNLNKVEQIFFENKEDLLRQAPSLIRKAEQHALPLQIPITPNRNLPRTSTQPLTPKAVTTKFPSFGSAGAKRDRVFISYSHADARWLDQLHVHLAPLYREGKVDWWDDTKLGAGTSWRDEFETALSSARVVVLLVSADFLASKFISDYELPLVLKAARLDGVSIFPVLVRPSRYMDDSNLSEFQACNTPSKTLIEMRKSEQERFWIKFTDSIINTLYASSNSKKLA